MTKNTKSIEKKLHSIENNDWETFLSIRAGAQRGVYLDLVILELLFNEDKKSYDHTTALMMSQILYWYLPDRDGITKLRVFKKGHEWLVKKMNDWMEEPVRLTNRQAERSLKVLREKGWVKTEVHRFNNLTMLHIRIIHKNFLDAYFTMSSRLFLRSNVEARSTLEGRSINRDYGTEIVKVKENSFSSEKDLSKSNQDSSSKRDQEELEEWDKLIANLEPVASHQLITSSSLGEKILAPAQSNRKQSPAVAKRLANGDLIQFFRDQWEERFGEEHNRLTGKQLRYVDDVFTEYEVGEDMIQAYFSEEFQEDCDHRILHFCNDSIINNFYMRMRV